MMIADLMEKLTDRGSSVSISADIIISAQKPGVSIDVFGSEMIEVYRDDRPYFTEFRGPTALTETLNFAG